MKRYKDIAGDGGSNIAGQVEAQQGRLRQRLASVRAIVAIVSGKGGVGKSTLTASLACCFAIDGWKVGVLDADLNGPTQAKVLGVRGRRLALADGVVVVTIPSDVSQLVVRRSITAAASTRAPVLGLVENMAGLFPGPDASKLAADAGIPFLGSVPFDRALADAGDQGEPFVATAPERGSTAALKRIAEQIRSALSPRPA